MSFVYDIGIILLFATAASLIAKLLKQPMIPASILAGIVIGALKLIPDAETILTFGEIGIAFLLFIVGLELNFKKLKNVGAVSSIGGLVQFAILFSLGFLVASLLGFIGIQGIYIALVLSFSSTMVIIKLLSDKKELETLHGRIAIGLLLMQDLIAIIALSLLSSVGEFSILNIFFFLLKGFGVFIIALYLNKRVVSKLFGFAAKSQELLFLLSLSFCFLFVLIYSFLGYSIAIGAFIAGFLLANLPYNLEIVAKIRSLRDFFAVLFFVSLGMQVVSFDFKLLLLALVILFLFTLLIKPLVTMMITGFFGYTNKTNFLTAMTLPQVSEFSLIILSQGLLLGHISQNIFSLVIVLTLLTIIVTSYTIKYDNQFYKLFGKYTKIFESRSVAKLEYVPEEQTYDIMLCGYDRIGYHVLNTLRKMGKTFVVIDFNPEIIHSLIAKKVSCMYGDIGDEEIVDRINLKKLKQVISTIPTVDDNLRLIKRIKKENPRCSIFVTAERIPEALDLYKAGADYVILPHFLGGEKVSSMITEKEEDIRSLLRRKFDHMEELKRRFDMGHEHKFHK